MTRKVKRLVRIQLQQRLERKNINVKFHEGTEIVKDLFTNAYYDCYVGRYLK